MERRDPRASSWVVAPSGCRPSRASGRRTASACVLVVLLAVLTLQLTATRTFADDAVVKIPNGDGLHCASNGTATRVFLSVRTKAGIDPASIRVVSDQWVQTKVVGATNSWLLRLKGPRPVAPESVQVVTSAGAGSVDLPGFDAPCPVTDTAAEAGHDPSEPVGFGTPVDPAPVRVRAEQRSGPIGGSLPFTGPGAIKLLPAGVASLAVGLLLVLGPRRPVRRVGLRYDGRFLAAE